MNLVITKTETFHLGSWFKQGIEGFQIFQDIPRILHHSLYFESGFVFSLKMFIFYIFNVLVKNKRSLKKNYRFRIHKSKTMIYTAL